MAEGVAGGGVVGVGLGGGGGDALHCVALHAEK